MAEKRPDTVGVFLGLITKKGRVRYQMRTEKWSPITEVSHKGDFELLGGGAKEKDLSKLLTPEGLLAEAVRETQEELGIAVSTDVPLAALYRTVFESFKTGKVDWAFAIPVFPEYWDETIEVERKIVDLDPDDLNVLGRLNLIVSGKKRMWRMGQAAIWIASCRADWRNRAANLLTEAKPDWRPTEFFVNSREGLFNLRYEIGLEEDLSGG